jgi:hypothetical protein
MSGNTHYRGSFLSLSACPRVYIISATHSFAAAFACCTGILFLGIVGYISLLERIEPIPEPVENEALG